MLDHLPQMSQDRSIIKNPLDFQGDSDGLRSLADLNRRIRFCRPPPNHSAKRPMFDQLLLLITDGKGKKLFRISKNIGRRRLEPTTNCRYGASQAGACAELP